MCSGGWIGVIPSILIAVAGIVILVGILVAIAAAKGKGKQKGPDYYVLSHRISLAAP